MPNEIPLNLCQVLEEEFENLHGPLPDEEVPFGGREATVSKDWRFHNGHVNRERLLARLEAARREWESGGAGGKSLDAETDPATFLVVKFPNLLEELRSDADVPEAGDAPVGASRPVKQYVVTLNGILADGGGGAEFFRRERFERLALRDETRALVELGWAGRTIAFEAGAGNDDDLTRFKRLLMEDAFPPELARVYDLRLARVYRRVHALPRKRAAVCLSGGGIRSGSFALGILQGFARRGRMLREFDYLSTVSGGGYIGGWLTAWIQRHPRGLEGVIDELQGDGLTTRLKPEPDPVVHLREYSSFVVPSTGLLSADAWSFVTIYIRNLLLNWTVIIPLLLALLMLPRVANAVVLAGPGWGVAAFFLVLGLGAVVWARPGWWAGGAVFLLLTVLGLAPYLAGGYAAPGLLLVGTLLSGYVIAFMRLNRPSNSGAVRPGSFWDRRKDQSSFLRYCLVPLALAATLLSTFWAWHRLRRVHFPALSFAGYTPSEPLQEFLRFGLFGGAVGLLGGLLFVVFAAWSWRGRATGEAGRKWWQILGGGLREVGVTVVAGLVAALLLYIFATKIDAFYTLDDATPFGPPGAWHAEWYTCLAAPTYLLAYFLGTTLFVGLTSRRKEIDPDRLRGARRGGGRPVGYDWLYIEDEDREWLARFTAWLFIVMAVWIVVSGLVVFGPLAVFGFEAWVAGAGGVTGLLTVLGGRSARTAGHQGKEAEQGWKAFVARNMLLVASFVFLVIIVILLSFLTIIIVRWLPTNLGFFPAAFGQDVYTNLTQSARGAEAAYRALHYAPYLYLALLMLALAGVGLLMAWLINLNKFSLHAGYRDRLIRAFLGASRLRGERRPNPFTGFDPRDNLQMQELLPGLISEADFQSGNALANFVEHLKTAADVKQQQPEGQAAASPQRAAAQYLRRQIKRMKGQSDAFFEQGKAEASSESFKSNLFADLNRILQTERLDEAEPFSGALAGLQPESREQLLLNRWLLERAFPTEFRRSSYPPPPYRLLHVVNMTLNLVGGDRLAWQQRKAESFTASPLHAGSLFVGYRRARDYGGRHGMSLGTAVAVSGAAASSNMGYFSSSPAITFVMTLFNVRLGWWLGNPGVPGHDTYFLSRPRLSLRPVVEEAFGLTDDRNPYVLLSDGGHFENLGLYEMVLRRCRHIVVVDGSGDPDASYSDLGNAVRKIRIDLGIDIDFKEPFLIFARPHSEDITKAEHKTGGYCAVADIRYGAVDGDLAAPGTELDGKLIYIKPAFYGLEPRDIYNYARSYSDFPHESTADQFFDEPQFESHRMLGYYIFEKLFRETPPSGEGGVAGFVRALYGKVS